MARHGDTRSPSPVGSTYSSSKRSRRDEDRYERSRRDDGRSYRRSRSPEVCLFPFHRPSLSALTEYTTQRRHRDRRDLYRRRDRSLDRRDDHRDDDIYRPGRRERSREHRRSRDQDDARDYRRRSRDGDRSRDKDYRTRRDDSRDRARRRRDDSTDSKRKSRRADSRDRTAMKDADNKSREVSMGTIDTNSPCYAVINNFFSGFKRVDSSAANSSNRRRKEG